MKTHRLPTPFVPKPSKKRSLRSAIAPEMAGKRGGKVTPKPSLDQYDSVWYEEAHERQLRRTR